MGFWVLGFFWSWLNPVFGECVLIRLKFESFLMLLCFLVLLNLAEGSRVLSLVHF